jgi:hypothetical protein
MKIAGWRHRLLANSLRKPFGGLDPQPRVHPRSRYPARGVGLKKRHEAIDQRLKAADKVLHEEFGRTRRTSQV